MIYAHERQQVFSPLTPWVHLFDLNLCQLIYGLELKLDYLTNISCFFVEFTGTMILALMIVAGCDKSNIAPPHGLLPLLIFLVLLGLGVALGMQTCKHCVYHRLSWAIRSDAINFFSVCFQSCPWFRSTHPPLFCWVRKGYIQLQKVIASFFILFFKSDGTFLFSQYWLWCPIIAPILGAQVGIGFYDLFLKKRDSESEWVSPLSFRMFDRNWRAGF